MSNPVLSDQKLQAAAARAAAAKPGWGAPTPAPGTWAPPIDDGPISAHSSGAMTLRGTVEAAGVLFALLLAGAVVGWLAGASQGLWLASMAIGFILSLILWRKPHLARILAPIYAVVQGAFVGAISRFYETAYDGIVLQAVGATVAVTAVMFALHYTRILKVTDRMRRVVASATMGLMLFYLVSFAFSMFGATPSFLSSASVFGIGFSIFAAGLAAFNLSIDFDVIERGVAGRAPAYMEWYAAFGLLVTVVWLYLELLRLLAKLQRR